MATPHLQYHLQLLNHLRTILVALGDAEQVSEESHALFLERFDELLTLLPQDPLQSQYLGQDLTCQVIQRYPQIAHLVPRDLLWFFGGDCLHFMPDEELDLYQQLEERRYEAERNDEPFDWHHEKQLLVQTPPSTHH
ncbi:PA2817 family protein [Pseudomonas juntendi]|uniref:Dehydrogenase n=1 Tax=Pseudomonas juntendi TaxID=2666183 RepID=A0A7W2JPB0_9PSED|nr:PA2817 family protein [Pseudomonas juntendi]MBA6062593.1 dehydrogenase [Pseudomonas juntendi]MBA6129470.1 dehydrogenase [Pseudomonas juntendi]